MTWENHWHKIAMRKRPAQRLAVQSPLIKFQILVWLMFDLVFIWKVSVVKNLKFWKSQKWLWIVKADSVWAVDAFHCFSGICSNFFCSDFSRLSCFGPILNFSPLGPLLYFPSSFSLGSPPRLIGSGPPYIILPIRPRPASLLTALCSPTNSSFFLLVLTNQPQ